MQNEQAQLIITVASLRMFLIIDYLGIHQSFDYTDSLGNTGCVAHHFRVVYVHIWQYVFDYFLPVISA